MLNVDRLFDELDAAGLASWREPLAAIVRDRVSDRAHGKLPFWRETLAALPPAAERRGVFDQPVVAVGPARFSIEERAAIEPRLKALSPWRKGPFRVGNIDIDAEWRSDLKWGRLGSAIAPLSGRRVLDVGCGNGYYAWRMRGAGAGLVVGIDPTLAHIAQFLAIRHWLPPEPVQLLPLRLHELPAGQHAFDTVFSMGVLYHQREPLVHLSQLRGTLVPGGQLVLETIVLPGARVETRQPADRYARMRNVWLLPTVKQLLQWLSEAGFRDAEVIDVTLTTTAEQRQTEWMPFESLAEALDPDDAGLTVEGWPAPRRAIVLAQAP